MKKFLVMLLALAVLLSISGVAFAGGNDWFAKFKGGSVVKGDVMKKVIFKNEASSESGLAVAAGNASFNKVTDIKAKAFAKDDDALASNDVCKTVNNKGTAKVDSGDAEVFNTANNVATISVCEKADTAAEQDTVSGDDRNTDRDRRGHDNHDNHDNNNNSEFGCCPAVVSGDVEATVVFKNEAEATSGWAIGIGNLSANIIDDNCSSATALEGGTATNKECAVINNEGNADVRSGNATTTNTATNNVNLSISKSANSAKTLSVVGSACAN
ncbi:MAG TPA: hypothetical protein VGK02_08565 [Candidatus Aquicultor sp.]|jgi:hypothetical protein